MNREVLLSRNSDGTIDVVIDARMFESLIPSDYTAMCVGITFSKNQLAGFLSANPAFARSLTEALDRLDSQG